MEHVALLSISVDDLRNIVASAVTDALERRANDAPASVAPKEEEIYLSREQVCGILHLTFVTLRNLELRGELKPVRIARRVLYRRSDVDAALNGRREAR